MLFFVIFMVIPFLEIMVFITVGTKIGLFTTLGLCFLTALIGGSIVKYQGLNTLMSAQNSLRKGELPSRALFDGLCIVAAGAMLITPGFITDFLGFSLLVPPVRDKIRTYLAQSGRFESMSFSSSFTEYKHPPKDPNAIDVDYEVVKEEDKS